MVTMTRWLAQLTTIFRRDSALTLNWWDCMGILDLQRVMLTCGAEDWHCANASLVRTTGAGFGVRHALAKRSAYRFCPIGHFRSSA